MSDTHPVILFRKDQPSFIYIVLCYYYSGGVTRVWSSSSFRNLIATIHIFISDHQIRRDKQKMKENPSKSFLKLDLGHLLRKARGFNMLALSNIIPCGYLC